MSTNFPTSLDNFTNPSPTDPRNSPSHASQHADANDAIEALEAKVGVDGSAVTSSHDYKLSGVTGTAKAVATDDARLTDARTPLAHNHSASEITSGTLDIARIPTGTSSSTVCIGDDARLSNSRTPTAHASSHQHGGTDEIATATPTANAIPKADSSGTLDSWISSAGPTNRGLVTVSGNGDVAVVASTLMSPTNGNFGSFDVDGTRYNLVDSGYSPSSFDPAGAASTAESNANAYTDTVVATKQPLDATLTALAGLTTAADRGIYFTGSDTASVFVLTSAGRALLDDADATAQRTTLGLGSLAVLSTVGTSQIDNDAVTYAKIQNVSATDKVLGRSSVGAGDVEEIACTAAGRALIDDADAAAQRTTLGLGSLATLSTVGTSQIDNDAVTDAKLRNGTACTVIGRSANSTGDVADIAASTNGTFLGRRSDALGFYSPKGNELTVTGAIIRSTANYSISTGTSPTTLFTTSTTLDLDTDSFTSGATTGWLKIPTGLGGWYNVGYSIVWDTIAAAGVISAQLIDSDANVYCLNRRTVTSTSTAHGQNGSQLIYLADGKEISLRVYQTTGGSINVLTSSRQSALMWLTKVGN